MACCLVGEPYTGDVISYQQQSVKTLMSEDRKGQQGHCGYKQQSAVSNIIITTWLRMEQRLPQYHHKRSESSSNRHTESATLLWGL